MIGRKFCPNCDSEDVEMVAGGITGIWMCRECGFSSASFPERTLIAEDEDHDDFADMEEIEEEIKSKKKNKTKKIVKRRKK